MRLTAAWFALAMTACAAFPGAVEKPTAEVRAVEVESAGLGGLVGRVHLDVFNPNGFGVPLRRATWQLYIGDALAVSGDAELTQTIPAQASAPVTTALRVGIADAARAVERLARGERRYTVTGTLEFSTRLGPIEVAFASEGTIEY